jgi:hypothetical protein
MLNPFCSRADANLVSWLCPDKCEVCYRPSGDSCKRCLGLGAG